MVGFTCGFVVEFGFDSLFNEDVNSPILSVIQFDVDPLPGLGALEPEILRGFGVVDDGVDGFAAGLTDPGEDPPPLAPPVPPPEGFVTVAGVLVGNQDENGCHCEFLSGEDVTPPPGFIFIPPGSGVGFWKGLFGFLVDCETTSAVL